jgi:hypothetical protein
VTGRVSAVASTFVPFVYGFVVVPFSAQLRTLETMTQPDAIVLLVNVPVAFLSMTLAL